MDKITYPHPVQSILAKIRDDAKLNDTGLDKQSDEAIITLALSLFRGEMANTFEMEVKL
jgi:hypothetical protein